MYNKIIIVCVPTCIHVQQDHYSQCTNIHVYMYNKIIKVSVPIYMYRCTTLDKR